MPHVFITGASGYIGGQGLQEISRNFPDFSITVLVRDEEKAAKIKQAHNKVNTVIGGLDDVEIVEREAAQANIVLNLAHSKHLESAQAIHRGLRQSSSNGPVFWIQISGATLLAAGEITDKSFEAGSASEKIFDDVEGIDDLRTHIKQHPFRTVDNYLLTVAEESPHVHTAVLIPPVIYGDGEGPINTRSIQVPGLIKETLKRGKGVQVGKGLNKWGNIHVRDLGGIVTALVKKANDKDLSKDIWGHNGLYLTSLGELSFNELSEKVALAGKEQQFIADSSVDELSAEDFKSNTGLEPVLFDTNARSRSRRATEFLAWKPTQHSLGEEVRQGVAKEAEALGLHKLVSIV